MFDLLLLASLLLIALILVASTLYYKYVRGLRERYEQARDVVGDIVVSFNSQLRRYEESLDALSHRTDEGTRRKMEEHEEFLKKLAAKVDTYSGIEQKVSAKIQDVDRRIEDLVTTQKTVTEKIAEVEKLGQSLSAAPKAERARIEAPIPIKRERALAPLTETELRVLQILADTGPKTAPEIRGGIGLTREHTARLMKKLYEEGYLERSARKLPYTYLIKKEMLKLLKKQA